MRVIIIDKTFKDSERVSGPFALLNQAIPDDYPMKCREVEANNIGEVKTANPGKTVMSATAYNAMHTGMINANKNALDAIDNKHKELWEIDRAAQMAAKV